MGHSNDTTKTTVTGNGMESSDCTIKGPVALIGIGEIGGVLARGLLKSGHPVYPVTRGMDLQQAARRIPEPELVVVAVGETALPAVLEALPPHWRVRCALIQNELLPADWQRHGLTHPTVASIWFEKKPGRDVKVLIPTPIYGPHAGQLAQALEAVKVPVRQLSSEMDLLQALVVKNLYILTTNLAGLQMGGTVSELWAQHRELAEAVFDDALTLQRAFTGITTPREQLLAAMLEGFQGDPEHQCMGRSAAQRLERAIMAAHGLGLGPVFADIAAAHAEGTPA